MTINRDKAKVHPRIPTLQCKALNTHYTQVLGTIGSVCCFPVEEKLDILLHKTRENEKPSK